MQQTTTAEKTTIPTAAQAFMQKQREEKGKSEVNKEVVKEAKSPKAAKASKYADYTVAELESSIKKTNEKLAAAKAEETIQM